MADYIKSREQLISFFKGEMHGPLDHSSVFPDISKLKKYNLDDELQFDTYKDARIPAIQENGSEILNLVSPLGDEEPTRRYGVGVLYPFKVETNDDEDEDEDNKLEFYTKPENISEDIVIDKKLKEDLFNKKLKRGKKKTKGDFVESVADVRTSNTLKQSSMGISFFANLTQDSILKIHNKEINDCGIYQKKEVQVKENTTSNKPFQHNEAVGWKGNGSVQGVF